MKLLLNTNELMDGKNIKLLLEGKGIPVFIANENSGNVVSLHTFNEYSVWIYIDEQLEDAKMVLINSDHEVKNPINIAAFQKQLDNNSLNFKKIMVYLLVSCFIGYCIFVYFYLKHT